MGMTALHLMWPAAQGAVRTDCVRTLEIESGTDVLLVLEEY